jgi:hypothetical protein
VPTSKALQTSSRFAFSFVLATDTRATCVPFGNTDGKWLIKSREN